MKKINKQIFGKTISIIAFLAILASCFCSCSISPSTIEDLYITKDSIYIEETLSHGFAEYKVVSDNYNGTGNVLLVRADSFIAKMNVGSYFSNYENSVIDEYLNGEFLNSIVLNDKIEETDIEITDESSIGVSGLENKTISRKVFLLSASEFGLTIDEDSKDVLPEEGVQLEYFANDKNIFPGWTRTPNTLYQTQTWLIDSKNNLTAVDSTQKEDFRPAFCVSCSQKIAKREDGKYVFLEKD